MRSEAESLLRADQAASGAAGQHAPQPKPVDESEKTMGVLVHFARTVGTLTLRHLSRNLMNFLPSFVYVLFNYARPYCPEVEPWNLFGSQWPDMLPWDAEICCR